MRKNLLFVLFFYTFFSFGQLRDNFSDGDFEKDPLWQGSTNHFIVNAAGQLQSNGPAVTGTKLHLATPVRTAGAITWEFFTQLDFATSAGNFADVFITSDSANLVGKNSGYFVRLGGTADEVSLFRKDAGKTLVTLINGPDKTITGTTGNTIKVKVIRSAAGEWQLYADFSGSGGNYVLQGTATDTTYRYSTYFGVLLVYSAANALKFIFDDFSIRDTTPPTILAVKPTGNRTLDILFSEPVSAASAQQATNFTLSPTGDHPTQILPDAVEEALVHLSFGQDFVNGPNTLTVSNIADSYGNQMIDSWSGSFTYSLPVVAQPGEVRVTEIFADYSPSVGLPEAEFFEVYNAGAKAFNLAGWSYSDATAATGIFPAVLLEPGEYLIVCRAADTLDFKTFGKVVGLKTFPALNDGGDAVELFDNTGKLIDKVYFTTDWYRSAAKAGGGWSLEIIDVQNPCASGGNWVASTSPAGGTPGKENAMKASNPDNLPPVLQQAWAGSSTVILLQFSEKLDSALSVQPAFYNINPALPITRVVIQGPEFTTAEVTLAGNLQPGQRYLLTVTGIRDCSGNILANPAQATVALPEPAVPGDVVINEILFNPRSGGVDFVELVNRSAKYLSLQNWQIGNIKSDSAIDTRLITSEAFLLAPEQYVVVTTRPDIVQQHYPKANPEAFLKVSSLPSLPDEAGNVVVKDAGNQEIDRVVYTAAMHFPLIDDVNGVSVERIRLDGPSGTGNFHSAAGSIGYATPGYRNSQGQEQVYPQRVFTIEPKVFTPDGDGDRDFTTINYTADKNGFVANITVYDANGRVVKHLVKNELLASQGFFQWDGTNNQYRKAPVGYYIFLIELFNLQGAVTTYKETVVVGGNF